MNLPENVFHRPNRGRLCGTDDDSLIRLPAGYQCSEVSTTDGLVPFLRGDWYDWMAAYPGILNGPGGVEQQSAPAYATASNVEFQITVIPEISCLGVKQERPHPTLFGALLDRFPSKTPKSPVDRIYELQTFGMALVDRGQGFLDLWLCRSGDKVLIPARAYCALYGLGETIIALELVGEGMRSEEDGEWRHCLKESGPQLLTYYNREEVVFVLNRLHINSGAHRFGVRLSARPAPTDRSIRLSRITRSSLAPFLHRELATNLDLTARFHSLGMRLHRASPEVRLPEDPHRREVFSTPIYFSGLLKDESLSGSVLRSYLCCEISSPGRAVPLHDAKEPAEELKAASWQKSFSDKFKKKFKAARSLVQLKPKTGMPFNIVIEGTGKWTGRCYRPAVLKIAGNAGRKINAYYANDESWDEAPSWRATMSNRRMGAKWLTETYLNKADPAQFRFYDRLRDVDAVFVVTPDVTHLETARHWLGRTPVVFVEKPFDTEAERFRELLYSMALGEVDGGYKTAVVGIDHYLLRLTPALSFMDSILTELGGLKKVSFEMTEDNPIEPGRERTLSLGLGMDMLPHFAAVLLLLGSLKSIDMVRVLRAIQYQPIDMLKFNNETGVTGSCRIRDFAGVPVAAGFCAGKGIEPLSKRLRLEGEHGKEVVIDYSRSKVNCEGRLLGSILESAEEAYEKLMSDLFKGRDSILSACLTVSDGEQIVRFLDAMWRATQWIKQSRGFDPVPLGTKICAGAMKGAAR